MTGRRYARLLGAQARVSIATVMQYRAELLVEGAMSLVLAAISLLPLVAFAANEATLPGWRFAEMLLVVGLFTVLRGALAATINPSLLAAVEHIRTGTLDFVLLKPADAQFLVSTARFAPLKLVDTLAGLGLCAAAFVLLGRSPGPSHLAAAALLLGAACVVLYSIWILVISLALWVVRIDNLSQLLLAVFEFARWPVTAFPTLLRILFTFVIPLALMTTYPALALLGRLDLVTGAAALLGAAGLVLGSRRVWMRALAHYTSASS